MRIKQIEWDDGYSFAGVQHIFVKLPLEGFSAKLTSYPHAGLWNIRTRFTLMASGEELSLSLAKVACQKAWEDMVMSAFEKREGCEYCLGKKDISKGRIAIINKNELWSFRVNYDIFARIEYCPKCGRRLEK